MSDAGAISSCSTCGKPVIWAKRSDDPARWSAPIDPDTARAGVAIAEGLVTPVVSYRYHECKVKDINNHEEVMAARARVKEARPRPPSEIVELDREAQKLEYAESMILRYTEAVSDTGYIVNALVVECERCGADEGEFCVNMSRGKLNGSDIKNPHRERIALALTEVTEVDQCE